MGVDSARAVGFDLCGVAPVAARTNDLDAEQSAPPTESFRELEHLPGWLARGYAGEMNYLSDPRRADPGLVLDGARSLIVVALNYNSRTSPTRRQLPDTRLPLIRHGDGSRATRGATTITPSSRRN